MIYTCRWEQWNAKHAGPWTAGQLFNSSPLIYVGRPIFIKNTIKCTKQQAAGTLVFMIPVGLHIRWPRMRYSFIIVTNVSFIPAAELLSVYKRVMGTRMHVGADLS